MLVDVAAGQDQVGFRDRPHPDFLRQASHCRQYQSLAGDLSFRFASSPIIPDRAFFEKMKSWPTHWPWFPITSSKLFMNLADIFIPFIFRRFHDQKTSGRSHQESLRTDREEPGSQREVGFPSCEILLPNGSQYPSVKCFAGSETRTRFCMSLHGRFNA